MLFIENSMSKKKLKTIDELFKEIHKYKTAKDLIEKLDIEITDKENNKSRQGFIYERLWDICIKFGLVKNIIPFDNGDNKLLHINGNINLQETLQIDFFKEFKDFFGTYLKTNIQSGNSGGYSDISFRNKDNIIISSAKYFEKDDKKGIKDYDIQDLCLFFDNESNGNKSIKVVLFINNKQSFIKKRKDDNKSSIVLTRYINPNGNYENVYDLNDLEFYFIELKKILNYYNNFHTEKDLKKFKEHYLAEFKEVFIPKFHQSLYIKQISKIIQKKEQVKADKNILIGAIPRTGKTYIMAGVIKDYLEKYKKPENNFIIITPAPTETIPQYKEIFNKYLDFNDINIIDKTDIKDKSKATSNNIYIFSKQKLDADDRTSKTKEEKENNSIIEILGEIKFDIIFIDEAHQGMTSLKSEKLLEKLKSIDTWRIFITATYNKPILKFNIPEKNKILWSLSNVINLKRIATDTTAKKSVVIKEIKKIYNDYINQKNKSFNKKIIDEVLKENYGIVMTDDKNYDKYYFIDDLFHKLKFLLNQYKDFPEPYLITTVWKNVDEIYNEIRLSNGLDKHTFSLDNIFDLEKDNIKFKNKEDLIELFHYFYGIPRKKINIDGSDDKNNVDYNHRYEYRKFGIIPRINNICENNCRTLQNAPNKFTSTTQLWFLPTNQNRIANKIPALLRLLEEKFESQFNQTLFLVAVSEKIKDEYIFNKENIKYNINTKEDIKTAEIQYECKYRNIVILTGEKFTLGISLPSVDIVVLFNDTNSTDLLYQMMFRSMTEIIDNNDCIPNSYCHKKKYGFIVDLNPQRTLLLTNYIKNNVVKNKNKDDDLKNKMETLDLLNIDRDFYKSKLDKDDEKSDKKDFTLKFFEKLKSLSPETTKTIFNLLKKMDLEFSPNFLFSISKFIKDYTLNNKNNHKEQIYKIGIDVNFRKIVREVVKEKDPNLNDDELNKIEEDVIDDATKIYEILSEFIEIIAVITGMNNRCIFDKIESKIDLEKLLKTNLDKIKADEELREIFIEFVDDKCRLKFTSKDFHHYYNFFATLINNIVKEKEFELMSPNSSLSSNKKSDSKEKKSSASLSSNKKSDSKKQLITDEICLKWKQNKLRNPLKKSYNPIKENGRIYKEFEKACSHIKTPNLIKGGLSENMDTMNDMILSIKEELFNIKKPDKLLEFINRHLKPTEKKKKENGEVFTPIELIQEMMDKLKEADPTIFSNPNLKWLDPSAGMGNFPVVVYLELMKGLSTVKGYENQESRRKWILEEMLYMVEYDKTNVFMMKNIFCYGKGKGKYKLNIFKGSFIEGERYIKEGIDIFSLKEEDIKKFKSDYKKTNQEFCRKINGFGGKFDIIMGNPPYNSGGISSKKKDSDEEKNDKKTVWPKFVKKSFEILKDNTGYLLFINPLSWLKLGHKTHNLLLDKYILWLSLWDVNTSKNKLNGEIPLSIYLLKNIENTKKEKTIINCDYQRIKFKINTESYLDNNLSIPLGFFSSLLKLQLFIKENNLKVNYKTKKVKKLIWKYDHKSKKENLPKDYKLDDNFCIDTYILNEGIKINKSYDRHIDADKIKLIIPHKSSLNGIFIDNGRLGICGNDNYYILGNNKYLKIIKKIMSFKLILIASLFTKSRQNYLDTDIFLYIPDLTKLPNGNKYLDITEDKFYKLIGLSQAEIKEIKEYKITLYE